MIQTLSAREGREAQAPCQRRVDKLLLRVSDVSEILSIGLTKTWELVNSGELRSITIGRSRRVPVEALQEWLRQKESTY